MVKTDVVNRPRLMHYSYKPLTELYNCDQKQNFRPKPKGLWVSVGREWRDWCRSERYSHIGQRSYIVSIDWKNIKVINNKDQLKAFTEKYQCNTGVSLLDEYGLNWENISQDYSGIVIFPYLWECRNDPRTNWYYGWDIASGCIWDISCVKKVTLVSKSY